jgi:hypothetical protein
MTTRIFTRDSTTVVSKKNGRQNHALTTENAPL